MARFMDDFYTRRGHTVHNRGSGGKLWDVKIDLAGKKTQTVEEKFRGRDHRDFLVELMQDVVTGAPGWFSETQCDYLHYVVCMGENDETSRPVRLYRINWPAFKAWLFGWLAKRTHGQYITSAKGWGLTLNISVPWRDVPQELYELHELSDSSINHH